MTIPFVIPIAIILLIMHFVTLHGYTHLIVFGGIYSLIYFVVAYLFVMNTYEKNFVNKILKKFHLKH